MVLHDAFTLHADTEPHVNHRSHPTSGMRCGHHAACCGMRRRSRPFLRHIAPFFYTVPCRIRRDCFQLTDSARTLGAAASMKRSSVRLSVCMSHHSTKAAACGGFAAERRAGRRNRSTAAAAGRAPAAAPQHGSQQQMRAVSL